MDSNIWKFGSHLDLYKFLPVMNRTNIEIRFYFRLIYIL